ncbi:hypothetical protein D3C81_2023430 [compost metagenome]
MSQIQPASSLHSASLKPRVVTAGVPKRRPEVTNGERGSFGTEFLLTVMKALPRAASASLPEISCLISDSRNRWFWVPPETTSKPRSMNTLAMAWAFFTTCCW